MHSENATQIDIVLDALKINDTYKSARFAIEVVLVDGERKSSRSQFTIQKRKSMDDSHTPGIFELVEIASTESLIGASGKFFFNIIIF